ncbi:hypothetical protein SVIOM342S_06723 [Streptomyces violaceorubidus]
MLEIVCTNTVPVPVDDHTDKLRILSIAPALAEAVRRIHNGESVSALFDARPARLTPRASSRVGHGGSSRARPVIPQHAQGQRVGAHQAHLPAPVEHLAAARYSSRSPEQSKNSMPPRSSTTRAPGRAVSRSRCGAIVRRGGDVDLAPELQHRVPSVVAHTEMPGRQRGFLLHEPCLPACHSLLPGLLPGGFNYPVPAGKSYPDRASLSMFESTYVIEISQRHRRPADRKR